ncbi:MAG: hypothetical protein AAFZ63_05275 [Bacteroidota bacterium]
MPLFRKSAVLDITHAGQAKITEEEGYLPFIQVKTAYNAKLVSAFLSDNTGYSIGFFYSKALNTVSLAFVKGKRKIGINFALEKYIKTLAGVMKLGALVIKHPEASGFFTLDLANATEDFFPEWREVVVRDFALKALKKTQTQVDDFEAYHSRGLAYLENNWMVEADE